MSENEDIRLSVEAWAEIVIKVWESKIIRKKITHTGELLNSFVYHVYTNSGGDPERIVFAFNYYGRFVDMGVGRGIESDDVGNSVTRRKKRPWFSATFDYHVDKLAEILAEKYGMKIASSIVDTLND
ncbi:MAG: hypothetical protein WCX31_04540 [Salinivirgaceae bacterium]|jgi:hypothetical protein